MSNYTRADVLAAIELLKEKPDTLIEDVSPNKNLCTELERLCDEILVINCPVNNIPCNPDFSQKCAQCAMGLLENLKSSIPVRAYYVWMNEYGGWSNIVVADSPASAEAMFRAHWAGELTDTITPYDVRVSLCTPRSQAKVAAMGIAEPTVIESCYEYCHEFAFTGTCEDDCPKGYAKRIVEGVEEW